MSHSSGIPFKMNLRHALLYGLNASLQRPRVVLALYLASLLFGLLLLLPLLPILSGTLGRSLAGAGIEARLDVAVIADLLLAHRETVRTYHQFAGGIFLLYLLASTLLAGGILETLVAARGDRSPGFSRFLTGCGRFFPRFLRLLLLQAPFLLLLVGANEGGNYLIRALFEDGTHAVAATLAMWGKQAAIALLFLWLAAAFDYARISVVLYDRRSAGAALGAALRFVAANPAAVLSLRLAILTAGAILLALYSLVSRWLLPEAAVVTLLLLQQVVVAGQRFLTLFQYAAELNLYRGREISEDARLLSRLTTPAAVRSALTGVLLAALAAGAVLPAGAAGGDDPPLADRIASYRIRAELLPAERTIAGEETVRFRNPSERPLGSLWFHLYPNAFRNSETVFMRESVQGTDLREKRETIRRGTWGYVQVESVETAGGIDLGTAVDLHETLMEVPLPRPLEPGGTVELRIRFRTRLPRTIARMGYRGDHYDVMQWFPKVAGLVDGVWNAQDFHADSEFFSHFGNYDVTLSVPPQFVVEATGTRVEEGTDPGSGNRLLRYRAEDVHDFAWVADPNFLRAEETYRGVEVVYLHQPYHRRHVERVLASVRSCLDFYGDHLMEYPWPRLVIDDLPMGLSGGMEYPMFFTVTLHWLQPPWVRSPEGVTIHEFGHQYWYGILASNEFEEPWLDEGVNTYVSSLVEDEHWGRRKPGRTQSALFRYAAARVLQNGLDLVSGPFHAGLEDFFGFRVSPFRQGGTKLLPFRFDHTSVHLDGWVDPNLLEGRDSYVPVADTDPLSRRAWEFLPGSYGALVYDKTYLVLKTLERELGRETMLAGLREYVGRHRFGHPTGDDFEAALESAAGRDLSIWFDQLLHGTGTLDYSVHSADSQPVAGPVGYPLQEEVGAPAPVPIPEQEAAGGEKEERFRSEVVLYRAGEVRLPVEILLRFEDGSEIRETWDGLERWKRLEYVLPTRLASAEIDPKRRLVLDLDPNNNSWTAERNYRGVAKISAILLFWFQNLLQLTSVLS